MLKTDNLRFSTWTLSMSLREYTYITFNDITATDTLRMTNTNRMNNKTTLGMTCIDEILNAYQQRIDSPTIGLLHKEHC